MPSMRLALPVQPGKAPTASKAGTMGPGPGEVIVRIGPAVEAGEAPGDSPDRLGNPDEPVDKVAEMPKCG